MSRTPLRPRTITETNTYTSNIPRSNFIQPRTSQAVPIYNRTVTDTPYPQTNLPPNTQVDRVPYVQEQYVNYAPAPVKTVGITERTVRLPFVFLIAGISVAIGALGYYTYTEYKRRNPSPSDE